MALLSQIELKDLKLHSRGKVRDVYQFEDKLMIVATDRISAYDCILPNPIPFKGQVLTQLTEFWLRRIEDVVPSHRLVTRFADFPAALQPYRDQLAGRSMLVTRAVPFPVECVVRGYLAGSGWKDYQRTGRVCGVQLPKGLRECERLEEPVFTPATKAQSGHDENIGFDEMVARVGEKAAVRMREVSLDIYRRAADYAASRGIIICDTKFEFGMDGDRFLLIDEVLTPDSSRFWPADQYRPGRAQPSFDKQFVRDYLDGLRWDHQPPAPELPASIVEATSEKYRQAYRLLTGSELPLE